MLTKIFSDFGATHVLWIHAPITLFLLIPILAVLTMGKRSWSRCLFPVLIALIMIATASFLLAYRSGEMASETVEGNSALIKALSNHIDAADQTKPLVLLLAGLSLVAAGLPCLKNRFPLCASPRLRQALLLALTLLSFIVAVRITQTAHAGGILVHRFGLHSQIFQDLSESPTP